MNPRATYMLCWEDCFAWQRWPLTMVSDPTQLCLT